MPGWVKVFVRKFRVKFGKIYSDSSFAKRAKDITNETSRQEIFEKGQATRKVYKDCEIGTLEEVARAWAKNGHHDNECRLCVYHALTTGNHSLAEIG